MIAHLDGMVTTVGPEGAVIDVGGVGLLIQCSPATLAGLRPGERARVSTSLVVREDALTLYGFGGEDERVTFELLQTASGIGPRLALAILATLSPDQLRQAVAAEDITALTRVPGIGRKGAARIVLELAGRLGPAPDGVVPAAAGAAMGIPGGVPAGLPALTWRDQVRAGLVNLGWQAREADQAIAAIEPDMLAVPAGNGSAGAGEGAPAQVDVAVALRAALRMLGRP